MKKTFFTLLILALALTGAHAQLKIGNNPLVIDPDAILHMEVTAQNKGVILPHVTTALRPTANAAHEGMHVYNTTTNTLQFCNGTQWLDLAANPPAYHYFVLGATGQAFPQSTTTKFDFTAVNYSTNGGVDFNLATDEWTCPLTGLYRIELLDNGFHAFANVITQKTISAYRNGAAQAGTTYTMPNSAITNLTSTGTNFYLLPLNAGDIIDVRGTVCGGCGAATTTSGYRTIIISRL